jgi:hypothetical protein
VSQSAAEGWREISTRSRLDWVDVAKSISIILVVMMHSTLGVEKAIGAQTSLNAFGALALFWGVRDTRGALLVGASGGSQARPAGRNGHWSGVAAQPSLGA